MKHIPKVIKIGVLTAFVVIVSAAAFHANPAVASSIGASKNAVCAGAGLAGGTCNGTSANDDLSGVVKTVITILSAIVGIAAVVMIIISGLRFVSSGGDSNKVSSAKNGLIYALMGLIVAAFAQILVHFVISNA
jgi:hypothetical protein